MGFGIVAYVDILYKLIWVFLAFSLLSFPLLCAYKTGTGYEEVVVPFELAIE